MLPRWLSLDGISREAEETERAAFHGGSMKSAILGIVLVALVGCTATPERTTFVAPTDPVEWCAEATRLLGDPYVDDFQKVALLEAMRNRGCLG